MQVVFVTSLRQERVESTIVTNYWRGIRNQDNQGRLRIAAETDKVPGTILKR